jgi:hypothetical protein
MKRKKSENKVKGKKEEDKATQTFLRVLCVAITPVKHSTFEDTLQWMHHNTPLSS